LPATKVQPDDVISKLTDVFRRFGYDGSSLAALAEATGLKKASLYHRFPGGKQEMAEAVLAHAERSIEQAVFAPLASGAPAEACLGGMCRGLMDFYEDGSASCLIETFSVGEGRSIFQDHIAETTRRWIDELKRVLQSAGINPEDAAQRAERCVMLVQGGLVVARATAEPARFRQSLEGLPDWMLTKSRSGQ
jgi:AcrR family transcriptional regulator